MFCRQRSNPSTRVPGCGVQPSRAVLAAPRKPSRSPMFGRRGAMVLKPWVLTDWPESR
ncbi:hypothetical protein [Siccirubricoccus sp. G192]|uniref:hypothetical protein n=1 Tax=Siccirubricoccus sp. G192 TaxID=2849651 RepID=UPI001C2B937C|nr:hypothetical protein [Siccirubricoccus sp. G192]MBV1798081.1 hypothetical protein [Siccirubricoccus sp. G192]